MFKHQDTSALPGKPTWTGIPLQLFIKITRNNKVFLSINVNIVKRYKLSDLAERT